jgi:hypothetical protein
MREQNLEENLKDIDEYIKGFNKDSAVDEVVNKKITSIWETELNIDKEDIHELFGIEAKDFSNKKLINLEEERSKKS